MAIPQEVGKAAERLAMTESIGGELFQEDLELVATWAVPLIQSGAIPSQEVINAIRVLTRVVVGGPHRRIVMEWLAKVEQKEESSE